MIADSPLVDSFSRVDFADTSYDDVALALQNAEYAEGDAAGFATDTFQNDAISANLVLASATTVEAYDADTGDVAQREVDRTELVPFRLDFANDLLEVFGSRADARRVQVHLTDLDGVSVSFEPLDVAIGDLHDALRGSSLDVAVTSLRVRNFSPVEHTTGDAFLRVEEGADAAALLADYGADAYFLGTELGVGGETVTVGFYDSGAIQVYSKTDQTEPLLDTLKNAVQ
jgi:hypothetical protein